MTSPRFENPLPMGELPHGDDVAPAGPMAAFLGQRIPPHELVPEWALGGEDEEPYSRIRAWQVPPVVGQSLRVRAVEEIPGAVRELLCSRCPGIPWEVPAEQSSLGLQKYHLVHLSVSAPPDDATGQTMALELLGWATRLGPVELSRGPRLLSLLGFDLSQPVSEADFAGELRTSGHDLEIRIDVATWANVAFPGAGVPHYE